MIQSLLHEQSTDPIAVKDEIGSICVLVAYQAVGQRGLSIHTEYDCILTYVKSAMSCDVCFKV
jgi:hypothetical protein